MWGLDDGSVHAFHIDLDDSLGESGNPAGASTTSSRRVRGALNRSSLVFVSAMFTVQIYKGLPVDGIEPIPNNPNRFVVQSDQSPVAAIWHFADRKGELIAEIEAP